MLLTADRVIDGRGNVIPDGAVRVSAGRIVGVGSTRELSREADDADVLAFPGASLLPGFIDTHAHTTLPGDGTLGHHWLARHDDAALLVVALRNVQRALAAGVTTVRDLGARNDIGFALRDALDAGLALGPRVLVCGRSITITGGHCHYFHGEADGPEGVRRVARDLLKQGADVIKVIGSGGGTPRTNSRLPAFTAEEIRAAVEEAHRVGRTAAVHVTCTAAIRNALDAGADLLEHCAFYEPDGAHRIDDALVERITTEGVFVGPTIQASYGELQRLRAVPERTPEEDRMLRYREHLFEHTMETTGRLHEAAVRLVANTDAGWDTNRFGDFAVGMALLVDAGVPPLEAIRAATATAAEAVGLEDEIGTIAPGKAADLLLVEGNPLEDIGTVAHPLAVYLNGTKVAEGGALLSDPLLD